MKPSKWRGMTLQEAANIYSPANDTRIRREKDSVTNMVTESYITCPKCLGSGHIDSRRIKEKYRLTNAQLRIAALAITGMTSKEIAAKLNLARNTVQHTLGKVFDKTGVSNKTELLTFLFNCSESAKDLAESITGDENPVIRNVDMGAQLTERERQILRLIRRNVPDETISEYLGIARKTVDSHVSSLHQKLNAHCRDDLIKYS